MKTEGKGKQKKDTEREDLPGYPEYPDNEDIYVKYKEERDIRPDELSRRKQGRVPTGDNEKDFGDIVTGKDLDVPGTELKDPAHETGNEDEENEYYSLGGEDHDDLEESKNG